MKIKGQVFDKPKPVSVVLPYGDENVLLQCGAVVDYADFIAQCPEPSPPQTLRPGNVAGVNLKDPKFLADVRTHSTLRTFWMIKESLKSTEDLVWDNVSDDKPDTWENLEKELGTSFGPGGVAKIIQAVLRANGLTNEIMGEARDSFLASQSLQ